MPSRAERLTTPAAVPPAPAVAPADGRTGSRRGRRAFEAACRVLAVLLLAWLLVSALQPPPAPRAERAGADLAAALRRWTARAPGAAWVALDSLPSPVERDWLVALRRAGTPTGWGGDALPALALEASAVPEPAGGTRIRTAAVAGLPVTLRDGAGVLDTHVVRGTGASVTVGATVGAVAVRGGRGTARVPAPDSLALGRLLVLARAGWEAKFAIAALEERGWAVDARLRVAPGHDVRQGAPAPPDTARYAAVIALDSSGADLAPRIARYVRTGGGLVLAGDAARAPAFAPLAAGTAGARLPGVAGAIAGEGPRRGLGLWPLARLHPDAIVLERRDAAVASAARRVALGRVVQAGYDDSWRWRMSGGDAGAEAHRAWWSHLVASAAFARPVGGAESSGTTDADPAPRAALAAALGPASAAPAGRRGDSRDRWRLATFVLVAGLLLAEWASRRARGAP